MLNLASQIDKDDDDDDDYWPVSTFDFSIYLLELGIHDMDEAVFVCWDNFSDDSFNYLVDGTTRSG